MYFCKSCGNETIKWEGRCAVCLEWGTLTEAPNEMISFKKSNKSSKSSQLQDATKVVAINDIKEESLIQYGFSDKELRNLFSGGLYAGSSYLISGEPGIGKSTLLLFISHHLRSAKSQNELKILYVCGEETLSQVKRRMLRTKCETENLFLTEDTNIHTIEKKIVKDQFQILFIDSLQTIYDPNINSSPGSINQMKYATQEMINFCRLNKVALMITGHINKSGEIAGPKLIEHLVDTSFFFYPTKSIGHIQDIRVLSSLKNRFGTVDNSSLFVMDEQGLKSLTESILDKSYFNDEQDLKQTANCGTCIFPHFIGKRLLFFEIECLITPTKLANPRRSVEGISTSRLNRILAIMEKYCGLDFSSYDVFVQVTGGFKGEDLLIDLSLIACIYSSLTNLPLPSRTIYLGEVGLSGKIKRVPNLKMRTGEIDSYGHFLYYSSHQDKNQVIVVKNVESFLERLKNQNTLM